MGGRGGGGGLYNMIVITFYGGFCYTVHPGSAPNRLCFLGVTNTFLRRPLTSTTVSYVGHFA